MKAIVLGLSAILLFMSGSLIVWVCSFHLLFQDLEEGRKKFRPEEQLRADSRSPASVHYAFKEVLSQAKKAPQDSESVTAPESAPVTIEELTIANMGMVENLELDQYLERVDAHPKLAVALIRSDLQYLSQQPYSAQLMSTLFQAAENFASGHPEAIPEIRDLAHQHLVAAQVRDTGEPDAERLLVAKAHEVYLAVNQDPRENLDSTMRTILNQRDAAIQTTLFHNLVSKHPELEGELRAEMARRQIPIFTEN